MRLERRWLAFLVVVALIFVGQVYVPARQAIACEQGELPEEDKPGQVNPDPKVQNQENPGQENPELKEQCQEISGQENQEQKEQCQESPGPLLQCIENPGPILQCPGNPGQDEPDQDDSCQDLDNKTVFYVLKEGYQIPDSLAYDPQLAFYNGIMLDQVYNGLGNTTYYGDPAVFLDGKDISGYFGENFLVPTIEQLKAIGIIMNEGDKIIWYALKREQNTWHVDGIKINCPEPTTTPTVSPTLTVSPTPTVAPETPTPTPTPTTPSTTPSATPTVPISTPTVPTSTPTSQENTNPIPVVPEVTVSTTPTVTPVVEEPTSVEPVIEEPEPQNPVEEEPVVEEDVDTEEVVDEPVPETLPQTGTSNPMSFYLMGGIIIIAGIYVITSRRKSEHISPEN